MESRAGHNDDHAATSDSKGKRPLPLPLTVQGDEDSKRRREGKNEMEERALLMGELEDCSPGPFQLSTPDDFFQINQEVDRPDQYRLILQKNMMSIDPTALPHGMHMQELVQTQQNTRGPCLERGSMPSEEVHQQKETAPSQNIAMSDYQHGLCQVELKATAMGSRQVLAPSETTDHVGLNSTGEVCSGDGNPRHLGWDCAAITQNAQRHRSRRHDCQRSAKENARRLAGRAKISTGPTAAVDQGPRLAQPPRLQPAAGAIIFPVGSATMSNTTGKAPHSADASALIDILEIVASSKRPLCPSLLDFCADRIANHIQGCAFLASLPDVLKEHICRTLCDKRRMTAEVLSLTFAGSKPSLIKIPDCSLITEAELSEFFRSFDPCDLTVLHLHFCGVSVSKQSLSAFIAGCRQSEKNPLTSLTLSGAWKLADDSLADLLSVHPGLKSLALSQCSGLTDAALKSISYLVGNALERLVLDHCKMMDPEVLISSVISMKNLQRLSLAGVRGVTDEVVEHISIHLGPNLKELILANCGSLCDKAMAAIGACCPTLEVLSLEDNISLTDVGLASIMNGCQQLQVLLLTRCRFSGEAVTSFVVASGQRLWRLSLNGLTGVTDEVLLALAKHSHECLEQVDASWCRQLSDEGLSTLADCCLKLCSLKLFGCTQVTRSFIRVYNNGNRSNSRTLEIYI